MTRRGLKPTGIAIFEAQQQGFASVAHHLQVSSLLHSSSTTKGGWLSYSLTLANIDCVQSAAKLSVNVVPTRLVESLGCSADVKQGLMCFTCFACKIVCTHISLVAVSKHMHDARQLAYLHMFLCNLACTQPQHSVLAWHRHSWQAEEAARQQSQESQHQMEQ